MTISNQSADDVQLAFDGPTSAQSPRDPGRAASAASSSSSRPATTSIEPSVSTISPARMAVGRRAPELAERPAAALMLDAQFGDHYRSIYLAGAGGAAAVDPGRLDASSPSAAEEALEERAAGYVFGSAGTGETERANRAAFDAWRIVPRMLRDVAVRDLTISPFGSEWPAPLGAGAGRGPDDRPSRRRAGERPGRRRGSGVPMTVGTVAEPHAGGDRRRARRHAAASSSSTGRTTPSWRRASSTRAEAAGYEAIVVTVDNAFPGWKPRDLQNAYLPAIEGVGLANFFSDPVFRGGARAAARGGPGRRRSGSSSASSATRA